MRAGLVAAKKNTPEGVFWSCMNNASCDNGDVPVGKEFRWVVIGKIDFANFLSIAIEVSVLREEKFSGCAVKSNPALAVHREVSG